MTLAEWWNAPLSDEGALVAKIYFIVMIGVAAFMLVMPATALDPRVMAATNITMLPTDNYNAIWQAFGGNTSPANETAATINLTQLLWGDVGVYTAVVGNLFFVIIFAIPFVLMWLMQGNVTIPSIVGIVLGVFVFAFVPAEYHLAAIGFIALSIAAIVYSLLKERL